MNKDWQVNFQFNYSRNKQWRVQCYCARWWKDKDTFQVGLNFHLILNNLNVLGVPISCYILLFRLTPCWWPGNQLSDGIFEYSKAWTKAKYNLKMSKVSYLISPHFIDAPWSDWLSFREPLGWNNRKFCQIQFFLSRPDHEWKIELQYINPHVWHQMSCKNR